MKHPPGNAETLMSWEMPIQLLLGCLRRSWWHRWLPHWGACLWWATGVRSSGSQQVYRHWAQKQLFWGWKGAGQVPLGHPPHPMLPPSKGPCFRASWDLSHFSPAVLHLVWSVDVSQNRNPKLSTVHCTWSQVLRVRGMRGSEWKSMRHQKLKFFYIPRFLHINCLYLCSWWKKWEWEKWGKAKEERRQEGRSPAQDLQGIRTLLYRLQCTSPSQAHVQSWPVIHICHLCFPMLYHQQTW